MGSLAQLSHLHIDSILLPFFDPGLGAALCEIANRFNEISRAIFPAGFLRAPKFGHPSAPSRAG